MMSLSCWPQALLEYETLSGDEIKTLIEGGTIVREDDDTGSPAEQITHRHSRGVRRPSSDQTLTRQPDTVQPERLTQPGFPLFADDRQHGGKSRTWAIPRA